MDPDWKKNYKIYGPGLVAKLEDTYGKLEPGNFEWIKRYSNGDPFKIKDGKLCKTLDQHMKDNPGHVKNFAAHSKGFLVVDRWMENHPEFTGASETSRNTQH